jgi:predicted metal-dependent phosphoesterase TrpH
VVHRGLCDPHIHTTFSDGRHPPGEVVDLASGLPGLDVIAITDHDCIEGALEAVQHADARGAALRVIVGEEVSSRDGHILGLFLHEVVCPDMSALDTIRAIHEQGGLAIAAHPFRRPGREGVATLAASLPFDAVEVLNGGQTPRTRAANRRAASFELHGRAVTAGSDAHIKQMVAACCTAYPGTGPLDFREAVRRAQTWPVRRRANLLPYLRHAAAKVARHPAALRELWPF